MSNRTTLKPNKMTHIRKAVFPVAGMGTRFLPAIKSIPKEMLTLVDRPLIQYAVDEAREAGIEEFIFVSAAGKGALEDYFDTAAALETRLEAAGKKDALDIAHEPGRIATACGMVEKPRADLAPSTKAVIGRYILEGAIFDRLDNLRPGAGGELQLTDAINADMQTIGVNGYMFEGKRFDCGSVQGYVQATAAFALDRADLHDDCATFLQENKKPIRLVA
jgi:UTP-glucose-1-phosphate uridylyltransferase